MNRTLALKSIRHSFFMLTLTGASLGAQELQKPEFDFTDACISADYFNFEVTLRWQPTPSTVNIDNEFIIELSDAQGNFADPYTLAVVSDENNSFRIELDGIQFPQGVSGDGYRMRWKSTSPEVISPASEAFGAYDIQVKERLELNQGMSTPITLCEGDSYLLEVTNYPNEPSYTWFKDSEVIEGEHAAILEVTEAGIYAVEMNYGDYCSSSVNTFSNSITVVMDTAPEIVLEGDAEVTICPSDTYMLTANIVYDEDKDDQDNNTIKYLWYRDGTLIYEGAENSLEVNGSDTNYVGNYYVAVEGVAQCAPQSNTVKIGAPSFDTELLSSSHLLLPGQDLIIQATTTAESPTYQWYKDGELLSGETAEKLQVTELGSYTLTVTQGGSCAISQTTEAFEVIAPDSIRVAVTTGDYSPCESSTATLALQSIEALDGEQAYALDISTIPSISYQWVYNEQPIEEATQSSLVLDTVNQNGSYELEITIDEEINVVSKSVDISLRLDETLEITAPTTILCDASTEVALSSSIQDPNFVYTWYRNGVAMTENSPRLSTSLTGIYQLEVKAYDCVLSSNEWVFEALDSSLLKIDVSDKLVIPEGQTKYVNASGADAYQWFNAKNELIGTGESVPLSEEGDYMVIGAIGDCQVIKTFTVTHLVSYFVPNIVTPNGDGFNDLWVIPDTYAYQKEVRVSIFGQNGELIFSTENYQNNWPESSDITFTGGQPPIYYYRITKGKQPLKQGTITLIK